MCCKVDDERRTNSTDDRVLAAKPWQGCDSVPIVKADDIYLMYDDLLERSHTKPTPKAAPSDSVFLFIEEGLAGSRVAISLRGHTIYDRDVPDSDDVGVFGPIEMLEAQADTSDVLGFSVNGGEEAKAKVDAVRRFIHIGFDYGDCKVTIFFTNKRVEYM